MPRAVPPLLRRLPSALIRRARLKLAQGKSYLNRTVFFATATHLSAISNPAHPVATTGEAPNISGPYAFGSDLCRVDHFHLPLYTYWCQHIHEIPRYHRKQWEFIYIIHALYERGMLTQGLRGLGFAVGSEPLPALFASLGSRILASDLKVAEAAAIGWVASHQHAASVDSLNEEKLCPPDIFAENVSFREIDMRAIPPDLQNFDFCWSACALEHLGSLAAGEAFIHASLGTLRPGGLAVHTTEFNLTSDHHTLSEGHTVIFRKQDILGIITRLREAGHSVEPLNLYTGTGKLARHIDLPPYQSDFHLKLRLERYNTTSIGLIVRRAA